MGGLPFYSDMPSAIKRRARKALERELGLKLDELSADAVIEQVWNVLVGHDEIEPPEKLKCSTRPRSNT